MMHQENYIQQRKASINAIVESTFDVAAQMQSTLPSTYVKKRYIQTGSGEEKPSRIIKGMQRFSVF